MKLAAVAIMLATMAICFSPICRSTEPEAQDSGTAKIKELISSAFKAMNEHDAEAWSMLFELNAELTNSVGQMFRGREAIKDYQLRTFYDFGPTVGLPSLKNAIWRERDTQIRLIRPGVAVVNIRWIRWNGSPKMNIQFERRGLMTWVIVEVDGEWSIATMNDMDLPLEPPNQYPPIPHDTKVLRDFSKDPYMKIESISGEISVIMPREKFNARAAGLKKRRIPADNRDKGE